MRLGCCFLRFLGLGLAFWLVSGVVWAAEGGVLEVRTVRQALEQGGFWLGQVVPGDTVKMDGKVLPVAEDGMVAIGFDRKQAPKVVLEVCRGKVCAKKVLRVAQRAYKIQWVKGVPPKTVEPGPDELARMKADSAAIAKARSAVIAAAGQEVADLSRGLMLPVKAPTSGVYGSARSYNGREETGWHKGHDLAARVGTPVRAAADGVVRLARDTFMSGKLLMLDHGLGVASVYAHLSAMGVKEGDVVKAGDLIAQSGNTGRSSGPHLHWGLYWRELAIDPMLWVGTGDQVVR